VQNKLIICLSITMLNVSIITFYLSITNIMFLFAPCKVWIDSLLLHNTVVSHLLLIIYVVRYVVTWGKEHTENFDFAGITSWTGSNTKWRWWYALTSELYANSVGTKISWSISNNVRSIPIILNFWSYVISLWVLQVTYGHLYISVHYTRYCNQQYM